MKYACKSVLRLSHILVYPALVGTIMLACWVSLRSAPTYKSRIREFNFEVQFPIKNQAAFRSSSKTTCG
ncbi:hypothetical protein ACETWI_20430, partial [Aeromonas hydrophila]|uniref:hypothetical protein n=1 Tax=Aeromonas hydrophila TaxID=644 RepID=UPI0035A2C503